MSSYKTILVPTDGTKLSRKAAHEAAGLAASLHARLTALYVMPPWSPPVILEASVGLPAEAYDSGAFERSTEEAARTALAEVAAEAKAMSVPCDTLAIRDDQPWKGIVKAACACDLIVMASHGRTGLEAMFLGSETRKVLAHATRPVLVCH